MTMHTLFLASPSHRGLLSGLLDLYASSLLKDFAWLEFGSDTALPTHAINARSGEVSAEPIQQVLNRATDNVLLVDVRILGAGYTNLSAAQEQGFLNEFHPPQGSQFLQQRVIFFAEERPETEDFTSRFGWTNIVVSPESSADPKAYPQPWWSDSDQAERSALASLVSLSRLWSDSPSELAKDLKRTGEVHIAKAFVLGTNAQTVQDRVTDQVLEVSERYGPLETESGAEIGVLPNSDMAAQEMANQWWHMSVQQTGLLQETPQEPQQNRPQSSFGEALKYFFRFLWEQLISAPRRIYQSTVSAVAQRAAGAVQELVYGQDAVHRVIVLGQDSQGRPASWQDIHQSASTALAQQAHTTGTHNLNQQSALSFDGTVRAFIDGGLVLADGRDSGAMQPVRVNQRPGIVDSVDRIAPDPTDWTVDTERGTFKVTDVPQIDTTLNDLAKYSNDFGASQTHQQLGEFRQRVHSSYVGKVLNLVSQAFSHQNGVIRSALHDSEQLAHQINQLDQQIKAENASRASGILTHVLAAVAILGVIAFWIFTDYPWWAAILSILLVLIIWLVVQMYASRKYIHENRKVADLEWKVNVMMPHYQRLIAGATKNMETLAHLALTLEPWAPVLAEFVRRPFGRSARSSKTAVYPTNLARSVQLLETELIPEETENYIAENRRRWRVQGWASTMWDDFMEHLPEVLEDVGQRQYFQRHRNAMYHQGFHEQALHDFSRLVQSNGVGEGVRDTTIKRIQLEPIHQYVQVDGRQMQRREFLDQINAVDHTRVVDAVLTTDAESRGANEATATQSYTFDMKHTDIRFSERLFFTDSVNITDLKVRLSSTAPEPAPEQPRAEDTGRGLIE